MVIGSAGLADLATPLQQAEARLGHEINPRIYATDEFRRKLASKHHFLTSVLPLRFPRGSLRTSPSSASAGGVAAMPRPRAAAD